MKTYHDAAYKIVKNKTSRIHRFNNFVSNVQSCFATPSKMLVMECKKPAFKELYGSRHFLVVGYF